MASQRVRGGGILGAKSNNKVAVGLTALTTTNATTATTNRSSSRFYHSTLASSFSSKSQRPTSSKSYRRAIAVILLMVMTVLAITMIGRSNISSSNSSSNNDDDQSQVTPDVSSSTSSRPSKSRQTTREWNEHGSSKSKITITIPGVSKASVQAILDARVHLIELHVVHSELRSHVDRIKNKRNNDDDDNTQLYDGIYGTFCRLDWSLHKNDPSTYPMFRDLVQHSKECRGSHRITNVPLRQIVQLARRYDESSSTTKVLNLTAAVFHESRCGSTLTANLLAAVEPSQHRVYSESTPPIQALHQICREEYSVCSLSTAAQMLQDVIYLMSRSDDLQEERVFFKIQSAGSRNVAVFSHAFPTTPYLFVFRDPVQVLMSHLKNGVQMANCLRSRDMPPASVERIATRYGKPRQQSQRRLGTTATTNKRTPFANRRMRRKNRRTKNRHDKGSAEDDDEPKRLTNTPAGRLSAEDYCAAHLASITETMLDHLQSTSSSHGLGRAVHYDALPDAYYTEIFPPLLGQSSLSTEQLERLQTTAAIYSKNRGGKRGVQGSTFESDSQHKEDQASDAVRQAAQTFLSPSYQKLLALSRDKSDTPRL